MHLFDELWSKIFKGDICEVLELILFCKRPDHGTAISVFEEGFEETADSIFLVDGFAESFLELECFFKILFGCDWLLIGVNKLQGEVSDNPHEGREILGILLWVCVLGATPSLDLDILGQVDDEGQVIQLSFIN